MLVSFPKSHYLLMKTALDIQRILPFIVFEWIAYCSLMLLFQQFQEHSFLPVKIGDMKQVQLIQILGVWVPFHSEYQYKIIFSTMSSNMTLQNFIFSFFMLS